MHKGYYGISGNRLSLRGVLQPADGSHRSRRCGGACDLDWIDLPLDSGPREPISTLFWGRHEVGVSLRGCMSKIREGRGVLCRVTACWSNSQVLSTL